jgi:hypothetical protein
MAQTCSPCSIPLCGKTVTKTRLEQNAEVMVMVMVIIIIIIIATTTINIMVIPSHVQAKKKNTKEGRGFESASSRLLVKHYTTELPQCMEIFAPICFL